MIQQLQLLTVPLTEMLMSAAYNHNSGLQFLSAAFRSTELSHGDQGPLTVLMVLPLASPGVWGYSCIPQIYSIYQLVLFWE